MNSTTICMSPGCSKQVAWSEKHNKYANMCEEHLSLHRKQCKVSNLKRKKSEQENKYKVQQYALLHEQFLALQKRNAELEAALLKIKSREKRVVPSS